MFEKFDRSKVEVHAFCWSKEDGTPFRARVKAAFDHLHPIGGSSDEAAARLIADNEIDVLVDLQGLSGNARPEIVARGPAPVQIAWLGYPGTTGLPHVDYVVADDFIFPPELEPFFSEKPLRLPTTFQVSDTTRAFGPERPRSFYDLPDDAFVFCAFNNNYKITPEMFARWLRILGRSPGSVLWLLEDNVWSRASLLARATSEGIDPARIRFAGRIDPKDYLSRFRAADLFLDTWPYNAGTTANDALWAGLPLVTLSGRSYVSRMAGSLLRSAGLTELICTDPGRYEDLAVELSADKDRLGEIGTRLRQAKATGRLFDTDVFRGEFEAALRTIVRAPR
jgi:predicted O-linked N-acetylglucosamine transferase (SPINDLY family)